MLDNISLDNIFFLDIETAPQAPSFAALDEMTRHLWEEKSLKVAKEGETAADVYPRAAIYAEFGKIICISAGFLHRQQDGWTLHLKSCFGDDERALLEEFTDLLKRFSAQHNTLLCAHNGKEFDFPYIARRMLVNGLRLPAALDTAGRKPWEVPFLDTMELWRFGDYKSYTSLKLLTHIFGIPSPKDDIDGSQVFDVYWRERDLPRIARYCEKDVVAIVQLLLRYRGMPLITPERVLSRTFPPQS